MFVLSAEGCFGYYELNLQELIAYDQLNDALQHFKELGNGIIFLNQLEHTIARTAAGRFTKAAPVLGIRPKDASTPESSPVYKSLARVIGALQARPEAAASPADLQDLLPAVLRSDAVFRPQALAVTGSTFRYALEKFKTTLSQNIHSFGEPDTAHPIPVESTTEFYRVWSAIQVRGLFPHKIAQLTARVMARAVCDMLPVARCESAICHGALWRRRCVGRVSERVSEKVREREREKEREGAYVRMCVCARAYV